MQDGGKRERRNEVLLVVYPQIYKFKKACLLQLKTYKVKSEEKPYIRVHIRELNRVYKYNIFYFYMLGYWFILH